MSDSSKEPRLTIKEYCDKLYEWANAMRQTHMELDARKKAGEDVKDWEYPQGPNMMEHIDAVFLAITKSSLLNRTMYGGEKLRTKKCPLHQGHWSGLYFEKPDFKNSPFAIPNATECECFHNQECSGWIPEENTEGFIGNQPIFVTIDESETTS